MPKSNPKRDPGAPKHYRSAYFLYQHAVRSTLRDQNPGMTFGQIAKYTAAMYTKMTSEAKEEWNQQAKEDKKRFLHEMESYVPAPGFDSQGNAVSKGYDSRKSQSSDVPPKRNLHPYILYQNAMIDQLKRNYPGITIDQLGKYTSFMYNNLTSEEKAKWELRAQQDKSRFEEEMDTHVPPPEYNAKESLSREQPKTILNNQEGSNMDVNANLNPGIGVITDTTRVEYPNVTCATNDRATSSPPLLSASTNSAKPIRVSPEQQSLQKSSAVPPVRLSMTPGAIRARERRRLARKKREALRTGTLEENGINNQAFSISPRRFDVQGILFEDKPTTEINMVLNHQEQNTPPDERTNYFGGWKDFNVRGYGHDGSKLFTGEYTNNERYCPIEPRPCGAKFNREQRDGITNEYNVKPRPSVDKFDGLQKDGKRYDYGTYTWANGSKYVGQWKDLKKHGNGEYTWNDRGKYVGQWKDDMAHGYGTYISPDGSKYAGQWKDFKRNGFGIHTWSNGNKYTGNYKDDKKHGHGIFSNSYGEEFDGGWKDDKPHGQAVCTFSDGTKQFSEWSDGKLYATNTCASGSEYVRKLKDGMGHDYEPHTSHVVTYTSPNGNKNVGESKDGQQCAIGTPIRQSHDPVSTCLGNIDGGGIGNGIKRQFETSITTGTDCKALDVSTPGGSSQGENKEKAKNLPELLHELGVDWETED